MDEGGWVPRKHERGFKKELWLLASRRAESDLHSRSLELMASGDYTRLLSRLTEQHYRGLINEMNGPETEIPTWGEHQELKREVRTLAQLFRGYIIESAPGGYSKGQAIVLVNDLDDVIERLEDEDDGQEKNVSE